MLHDIGQGVVHHVERGRKLLEVDLPTQFKVHGHLPNSPFSTLLVNSCMPWTKAVCVCLNVSCTFSGRSVPALLLIINLLACRFSEVADLLSVWWLEIRAAIKATELSPHTWYAAYFVLKHKECSSGFNLYPVELALSMDDGTYVCKREAFIHPDKRRKDTPQPSYAHTPPPYGHIFGWLPDWPRGRRHLMTSSEQPPPSNLRPREGGDDGWMEVEIGVFYTNGGEDGGGEVEFSLLEVNGVVKKGLVFDGIEIRPKTEPYS